MDQIIKDGSIKLRNIDFEYSPKQKVIQKLNFDIPDGSLMAVTGANGSGKSTLLKIIAGELKPTQGKIIKNPFVKMAYLPQRSEIDYKFPLTIANIIAMGLWPSTNKIFFSSTIYQQIKDLLAEVGLGNINPNGQIGSLSGGQLQRILFARIIALQAQVVLLDEPFNAIDHETTQDLIKIILKWWQAGKTIVAVLHDVEIVSNYFPQVLNLDNF